MKKIEQETLAAADERKKSHLDLAFEAQSAMVDNRFYYEPMLAPHPFAADIPIQFGNKMMHYPIWISSMTGGTAAAGPINKLLAKTARKYGLGMGLGSCRIIVEDNTYLDDFNLRPILGDEMPLYANLGIAQVEQLIENKQASKIKELIQKLDADGLIVHVNPLQEWIQPEGDIIRFSPIETIKKLLNELNCNIIVKEVGQGFGPESMKALLELPLLAIDFAANGGTNFSKLELLRNQAVKDYYKDVVTLGHSANEMIEFLNLLVKELGGKRKCNQVIVSGGVQHFLDGYYFINKSTIPAVYGQASAFLKHAMRSQKELDNYTEMQIKGLQMAENFLKVRP